MGISGIQSLTGSCLLFPFPPVVNLSERTGQKINFLEKFSEKRIVAAKFDGVKFEGIMNPNQGGYLISEYLLGVQTRSKSF